MALKRPDPVWRYSLFISGTVESRLRIPGDVDQRSELMSITIPK